MHDYALDTELVRLAILLGVVVSLLFYDRFGLTTGGVIVPGYLALFVLRPTQIAATAGLALVVYWIVYKLLRPRLMLWGRRLFEAEIMVTLALTVVWLAVLYGLTPIDPAPALLYGIGFLLPGILAHDMGRQGVRATLAAAGGATLVVFALVTIIGAFRDLLRLPDILRAADSSEPAIVYGIPPEWLLVAVVLSVLVSVVLYRRGMLPRALLPEALRSGGLVTAGYLALFLTRPADLLFVLVCGGLTYLIVTQVLMKQAILFGRTKMAVMFLTAMAISWLVELALAGAGSRYIPWQGFNAIAPTIIALVANDAERQGPGRTLMGTAIAAALVFVLTSFLYYGYTWFSGGSLFTAGAWRSGPLF